MHLKSLKMHYLGSGNVWIGVFHYWEILENNAEMSTNPCLVQLRSWAHLPEWGTQI